MTIQEAKANLKKFGAVCINGVKIAETKTMRGNWQEYTGRYVISVGGEIVPETYDDSVSFSEAFKIARKYFHR